MYDTNICLHYCMLDIFVILQNLYYHTKINFIYLGLNKTFLTCTFRPKSNFFVFIT